MSEKYLGVNVMFSLLVLSQNCHNYDKTATDELSNSHIISLNNIV